MPPRQLTLSERIKIKSGPYAKCSSKQIAASMNCSVCMQETSAIHLALGPDCVELLFPQVLSLTYSLPFSQFTPPAWPAFV